MRSLEQILCAQWVEAHLAFYATDEEQRDTRAYMDADFALLEAFQMGWTADPCLIEVAFGALRDTLLEQSAFAHQNECPGFKSFDFLPLN